MSELQPQPISFRLANQLADDPIITANIVYRLSQASGNDNFDFMRSTELESELADVGYSEKDDKVAIDFGDAEFLFLGLYVAYLVIVVGATVVVFLEWRHVL